MDIYTKWLTQLHVHSPSFTCTHFLASEWAQAKESEYKWRKVSTSEGKWAQVKESEYKWKKVSKS